MSLDLEISGDVENEYAAFAWSGSLGKGSFEMVRFYGSVHAFIVLSIIPIGLEKRKSKWSSFPLFNRVVFPPASD
jgi:hypothetical protein